MKKVLFTGIMLLSFAAAQASNNVGEAAKSKTIASGKKEVVAKQRLNDDKALSADKAKLMITCYA